MLTGFRTYLASLGGLGAIWYGFVNGSVNLWVAIGSSLGFVAVYFLRSAIASHKADVLAAIDAVRSQIAGADMLAPESKPSPVPGGSSIMKPIIGLFAAAALAGTLALSACAGSIGDTKTPAGRQRLLDNATAAVSGAEAFVSLAVAQHWVTDEVATKAHAAAAAARILLADAQVALNSPECQAEKVDVACGMNLVLAASQAAIDIRVMVQQPAATAVQ